MSRLRTTFTAIVAICTMGTASSIYSQVKTNVNPNAQPAVSGTANGIQRNVVEPGKSVTDANKITQPIPLNAVERESALAGIDTHIGDEAVELKNKLKNVLPDELAVLTKTVGWAPEKQSAFVTAFRAGDPAAIYTAWTQGNPQDTAGAEIVSRQAAVRRAFSHLEDSIRAKTSIIQDLADLEASLGKVAASTPGAPEVVATLSTLKTWAEVRKLVDAVVPDNGRTAKLPIGKVPLIYDSSLPVGKAIVLGQNAVMIGNQGKGPISIRSGIAAEALGMPIVTGQPVADVQGDTVTSGVLLINAPNTNATITYNVNGNRYVMEPGMTQKLPDTAPSWTIEYDRGGQFGAASYTVTQGTYFFTPTDKGWQLYKQRFDVALDNSQSNQEFNFLLNDEKMVVPANGAKTISSIYPMVIRYDRGNGTELAAKLLNFNGTVQIGVNVADNRWDVFPTTANQRAVANLKLFEAESR
jgi:hypothetical protein